MSLPIPTRHPSVGEALRLWEYLSEITRPTDAEWRPVADGLWITDTQLAYRLDVTESTVRRWRKKLEALGYVYSLVVKPRYRRFWVANANAPRREQTLQATTGFVN